MFFIGREIVLFPIDRTPRRGKNNLFDIEFPRCFENVQASQYVHARIKLGIGDRASDIHLSCVVIDDIDCMSLKDLFDLRAPDVELMEFCFRIDILPHSRGEIVNYDDVVPFVDVRINDMGTNESCTTCNEYSHVNVPVCYCETAGADLSDRYHSYSTRRRTLKSPQPDMQHRLRP